MRREIPDAWLYAPTAVLLLAIGIRLFQFRKVLSFFPFYSDLATHLPRLFFLREVGFHGLVPYWYQGFTLFQSYPPGWFFAALPSYLLSGNLQLALYTTLLLTYLLGLGIFMGAGRWLKLSLMKRLTFFALFLGSPPLLDYLTIGRAPELLAWSFFALPFAVLYRYVKQEEDRWWWLVLLGSALLLVHVYVFVPLAFLLCGAFLARKEKRWMIVAAVVGILLLTSFWWVPFLMSHERGVMPLGETLDWSVSTFISFNTVSVLLFLLLLGWRWKDLRRGERLFLLPSLLVGFLILTRLIVLVPVANLMPVTPYTAFFLFLSIFLFLQAKVYPLQEDFVKFGLILVVLVSTVLVFWFMPQPKFEHAERDVALIQLMETGKENFLLIRPETLAHPHPLNAYGAAMLRRVTPSGNHYPAISAKVERLLRRLFAYAHEGACESLVEELRALQVEDVLSYDDGCYQLAQCGWARGELRGTACLFKVPQESADQ